MNKIVKRNGEYVLTLENGAEFICSRWLEKSKDTWHIIVPKEAREICGRTYIREKLLINGSYEFENKLEHRSGLTAGGWRSKLTAEESEELKNAEETIERLKKTAMEREVPKADPNSIEGIEIMIAKLLEKQKKLMEARK